MANMIKIQAQQNLGMTQAIGGAFSGEALASLAESAGLPERDIISLKMSANRNNMQIEQGTSQWQ
jgi:hypothetical protein